MNVSGQDEAELAMLLQAAIAGDDKAYVAFLRRTGAIVRGFARRKIVDSSLDPEDIVQDTLLAIHTKRHTWVSDAPVLPWIYAIARFKLIDAFRKRGRRVEIEISDIIETVAQQETETVSDRDMHRVIDGLAPGQRSVVAAISIEGHSIGETAVKYGMTETAVRVALHRGLRSIAKRFGRS